MKKKSDTKKIKKRVSIKKKPKYTKTDLKVKYIFYVFLLILLIACQIFLGKEFTIIAAIGILIILGLSALIRKSHKKGRLILTFLLILFLTMGIGVLCGCVYFMFYIKSLADPLFKVSNLNTAEITIIYDKDGQEIVRLGSEKREKVTYDELPEVLVDAIVATEDSRFFQHNGFDAARFIKAAIGQALGNSSAGGASTLSMQVVKNSFTDANLDSGTEGIIRKFEDIYLAVFKLEKTYTKEQIIEFYVNNHFLGGNIYGVQEAAETYFGKDVSELNLSEASILAGMFKSPNAYKPTTNPEEAENRRKTVLSLMRKHGYITKEEENLANSIPVSSLTIEAQTEEDSVYQGYIDTVAEEIQDKYGVDPYSTSLLVYTNLDRSRQDAVNSVLNGEAYTWKDDRIQTGVAVLESETGKILAIGNGRNRSGAKNFNYATQLERQPGSTAKPLFDYGPGIEYNNWSTYGYQDGDNVYRLFVDAAYKYSNGRSIKNWDGGYYGAITLRRALSTSRNIPALKAFQMVDKQNIINFVTSLGITPEIENGTIHEAHSIGAFTGVSPLQMAGAYAAFSNGGYYNEPYSVSKIVFRSSGQEIEHENNPVKVMSDATAYMIASVLEDVVLNSGGTPQYVAVKTGTTNYDDSTMNSLGLPGDAIRDSWVVGFSTKTTIGMWYGYDSLEDFKENPTYILHNIPATIAKDKLFRALVLTGAMESDRTEFTMPSSVVKLPVLSGTNPAIVASNGYSGSVTYELFKKDYQPSASTAKQQSIVSSSSPSNLTVSYNNTSHTVTMSWTGAGISNDSTYGEFGYNIYLGDTLLGWTNDTTYSFQSSSPYGTYKVVGTYKDYTGIQTSPATYTLKEEKTEAECSIFQTQTTCEKNGCSWTPETKTECAEDDKDCVEEVITEASCDEKN